MAYSGKYNVKNKSKYMGDVTNVVYRSLWERRVMVFFDKNDTILEWSSEEVVIPYISKLDGKRHRYFVDFKVKFRDVRDGIIKTALVEVKPKKQTLPPKIKKRRTKRYLNEVKTWVTNQSKWEYAIEYCKERDWQWWLWTEDTLDKLCPAKRNK
jgi:hypothetical protein